MAWPVSNRAVGHVVQAADWNEVAAAPASWGGDANANGNSLKNVAAIYIGAENVDGTWRITTSGNNLVIERRESGVYVTLSTVSST